MWQRLLAGLLLIPVRAPFWAGAAQGAARQYGSRAASGFAGSWLPFPRRAGYRRDLCRLEASPYTAKRCRQFWGRAAERRPGAIVGALFIERFAEEQARESSVSRSG